MKACMLSSPNLTFLTSGGLSLASVLCTDELDDNLRGVEPFLRLEPVGG